MRWSFNKVRYLLNNIENCAAYYIGGSLCIDCMPNHPNILINRNGRGFFYGQDIPTTKFVVSNDIKDKVNELYKRFKCAEQAPTEHTQQV